MVRSHLYQEHCEITSPLYSINKVHQILLLPFNDRVASQPWLNHEQSQSLQIQVLATT